MYLQKRSIITKLSAVRYVHATSFMFPSLSLFEVFLGKL